MGNSEWIHFVPYEEDIELALQRLRRYVFRQGAYFKGWPPDMGYAEDEEPASLEELVQRTGSRTHSILDVSYIYMEPITPVEPLPGQGRRFELQASQHTSAEPEQTNYRPLIALDELEGPTLFPLSRDQLLTHFGTVTPTKSMVGGSGASWWIYQNQCTYVFVYEDIDRLDDDDARPEQIGFFGWSGGG
jgi:hypothetical protein